MLASGFVLGALTMGLWSPWGAGEGKQNHAKDRAAAVGSRGLAGAEAAGESAGTVVGLRKAAGEFQLDDAFLEALADPARRAAALRAKSREVLSIPHPGKRLRAFTLLMTFSQAGDLEAIHGGMTALEKTHGLFPAEYEEMMHHMSEVNGAEVMSRLTSERGANRQLLDWQRRCVANWAGADAAAAVNWWNALPDGRFRNSCASQLIEGVAWTDAAKAWEIARHLEPQQRADAAGVVAAEMAKQQGVKSAAQWLAGLGEEEYQEKMGVLRKLVDFVRHQPAELKREVIDQFQNERWALQSDSFGALGEDWGRVAGPEAAEWAAGLSDEARRKALPRVVRAWSKGKPEEAAAWMGKQTGTPEYGELRREFLDQINLSNPDEAAKWEAQLPPAPAAP